MRQKTRWKIRPIGLLNKTGYVVIVYVMFFVIELFVNT